MSYVFCMLSIVLTGLCRIELMDAARLKNPATQRRDAHGMDHLTDGLVWARYLFFTVRNSEEQQNLQVLSG